jgi:uncharacterized protein (TIGR02421 family)
VRGALPASERKRVIAAATALHAAVKPVKVLKAVDWDPLLKQRFLDSDCQALPQPEYRRFDPAPTREALIEARRHIAPGDPGELAPIDAWLARQALAIEGAAAMLAAIGTAEFFAHGRALYGEPKQPLRFHPLTPMDLAAKVHEVTDQLDRLKLDVSPPVHRTAAQVADELAPAIAARFGDAAPEIRIVDVLSANALASAKVIKLKRSARFTDRDAQQLLQHEGFVHAATAINGRAQTDLPILGCGHPGNARTQEGLAVFAELASSTLELDRLGRLADRVFAIQMAIDGADFVAVHRWFVGRGMAPDRAFDAARRAFRGGLIGGGAPFTKDVVYLFGLLQVINTFRAVFAAGRADCLQLLFCGKLDLLDLPALGELAAGGLLKPPRFLPPWISDPRSLYALLAVSSITSRIDLVPMAAFAEQLLARVPRVELAAAAPD